MRGSECPSHFCIFSRLTPCLASSLPKVFLSVCQPTPEEKALGKNVLYLLTKRRESVEDLARGIGVSSNSVYSWIAGQMLPGTADWPKLCDYLGVTKDQLLNRNLPIQKKRPKAA